MPSKVSTGKQNTPPGTSVVKPAQRNSRTRSSPRSIQSNSLPGLTAAGPKEPTESDLCMSGPFPLEGSSKLASTLGVWPARVLFKLWLILFNYLRMSHLDHRCYPGISGQ